MSKIQKIEIKNFKALGEMIADFNGCTAIITGGNNKGKTSLLRGITDRIRGERPELIVKDGEIDGNSTLLLTSGEKFVWEFDNNGKDKLSFYTKEGYKSTVTKEIAKKFFPPVFDIDKFLNSAPADQSKQLQKILGIDFTDINNRYKVVYDDRTEKNREAERFHVKLSSMIEAPKIESVNLVELQAKKQTIKDKLNALYLSNKNHNQDLRNKHEAHIKKTNSEIDNFNQLQLQKAEIYNKAKDALKILFDLGYAGHDASDFVESLHKKIENTKQYPEISEPKYITELPDDAELQKIDAEIFEASETNTKAKAYIDFLEYKGQVERAKGLASEADIRVKDIETERANLIKSVKVPAGIAFTEDGITVDGLPLDKNQLSTSKLYCAALRLGSLNLGEVKTMHFDASTLDNITLAEINKWATSNDLQLLIERPDMDGGDIHYELIEIL